MMEKLPFIPTTTKEFEELMCDYVWQDHCEAAEDGGTVCFMSIWYEDWKNANRTARFCKMVHTGNSKLDGESAMCYRFADDDGTSIVIARRGAALQRRLRQRRTIHVSPG